MTKNRFKRMRQIGLAALVLAFVLAGPGRAMIMTVKGPTFNLTATDDFIQTPDGGAYYMFGYANSGGGGMGMGMGMARMSYPGPTLDVNEGDFVTVNLINNLTVPVSIVFPGQTGVMAMGDSNGLLTAEADPNGGMATYTFVASHPGTYLYHSGTNPELQIEMGLLGALIVRPAGQPEGENWAYNHADSAYDYETLFLLTEIDPVIHDLAACGMWDQIDLTEYWPVYWFINGRCAPDTMLMADHPLLPTQPHDCMPRIHPGERLLMRVIGGGRDAHPFHTHGNNFLMIAQDGRLLSGVDGADLAVSDFTLATFPGQTYDALFSWTGAGLGWDIYGHDPNDELDPGEYAPDHGKPIPVTLPTAQQDLTFGAFYSGSPYLGGMGTLPPGEGGMNMNGGFFYMWHSHNEKEMVNNDIFPGGLMTMFIVEPHGVPID